MSLSLGLEDSVELRKEEASDTLSVEGVDEIAGHADLFRNKCREVLMKKNFWLPKRNSKACRLSYYKRVLNGEIVVLMASDRNQGTIRSKINMRCILLMIYHKIGDSHGFDLKHLPERNYLVNLLYAVDKFNPVFRGGNSRNANPLDLQQFLNCKKTMLPRIIIRNDQHSFTVKDYKKVLNAFSNIIHASQELDLVKDRIMSSVQLLRPYITDITDINNRFKEFLEKSVGVANIPN